MRPSKKKLTGDVAGVVATGFGLLQHPQRAATAVAAGVCRRSQISSSFRGLRLAVAASHPLTTPSLRLCNGKVMVERGWSMDRSGPLSFLWAAACVRMRITGMRRC